MPRYQPVQLNITKTNALLGSPTMKDSLGALGHFDGLADKSPGFRWRRKELLIASDLMAAKQLVASDDAGPAY